MLSHLAEQLAESTGLHASIWLISLRMSVLVSFFLPFIGLYAMLAIWSERKIAGHIQGRYGPKHVGPFGLFQSLADGIKCVLKEDLVPAGSDSIMFRVAPYVAFIPVFIGMMALPFGPQWTFISTLNVGVLFLLAVLALEVIAVIMAGWSSNSKWSIYGGMREACQMVSYEIPLGVSIICGVLVAGTLNLVVLCHLQGGGLHDWLIFHNPFIFIAFFIYFISSLASAKRAPFDLPEAESELVAGFMTEYSGMRWAFFMFGEYVGMYLIGAIMAVLFLGGWNSPLGPLDPVYNLIGYDPVAVGGAYITGDLASRMADQSWTATATAMGLGGGWVAMPAGVAAVLLNVYSAMWIIGKAVFVVLAHIWLRWTLPRIRIDQVMHACVKVLLPLSLVMLLGVATWVALVPQALSPNAAAAGPIYAGHVEGETPLLQLLTQVVLMVIGLGIFGWYASIALLALLNRKRAPRKSLFEDIMPVSKESTFRRGEGYIPDADRGLAKP
jgi:NADH-quinone oxidoreductase subunit H